MTEKKQDKEYSGRLSVKVTPEQHKQLRVWDANGDISSIQDFGYEAIVEKMNRLEDDPYTEQVASAMRKFNNSTKKLVYEIVKLLEGNPQTGKE